MELRKPEQRREQERAAAARADIETDVHELPNGAGLCIVTDVVETLGLSAGATVLPTRCGSPRDGDIVLVRFKHSSGSLHLGLRGFFGPDQIITCRKEAENACLRVGRNGHWEATILGTVERVIISPLKQE